MSRLYRHFGAVSLMLLALTISCQASARSYDDIKEAGVLTVALYDNFAPYSYKDENGKPTGIDVDLATLLAQKLEVEPNWLWMAADESVEDDLRNAIWKGRKIDRQKADIMMRVPYDKKFAYGIDGYGLPRNEFVVMFAPYHTESWRIARDLEKVGKDRNLAIFRFEKIGVEIDSLPDSFLLSAYRGTLRKNVVHFNTTPLAIESLLAGDLAAVVGMRNQVVWALGKHASKYDIDDDGLAEMASKPWSIGIATGHEFRQLAYALEEIVDNAIGNGEMAKIFADYGLEYVAPAQYSQ